MEINEKLLIQCCHKILVEMGKKYQLAFDLYTTVLPRITEKQINEIIQAKVKDKKELWDTAYEIWRSTLSDHINEGINKLMMSYSISYGEAEHITDEMLAETNEFLKLFIYALKISIKAEQILIQDYIDNLEIKT